MKNNKDDEVYVKLLASRNALQFKEQMEDSFPEPIWLPFVYIVALEHRHAEVLARANQIPPNYWKHVSQFRDLAGAQGKITFYYRWYELREAEHIRDYVLALKGQFVIIELSDKP